MITIKPSAIPALSHFERPGLCCGVPETPFDDWGAGDEPSLVLGEPSDNVVAAADDALSFTDVDSAATGEASI
jgi:hypothetical protein